MARGREVTEEYRDNYWRRIICSPERQCVLIMEVFCVHRTAWRCCGIWLRASGCTTWRPARSSMRSASPPTATGSALPPQTSSRSALPFQQIGCLLCSQISVCFGILASILKQHSRMGTSKRHWSLLNSWSAQVLERSLFDDISRLVRRSGTWRARALWTSSSQSSLTWARRLRCPTACPWPGRLMAALYTLATPTARSRSGACAMPERGCLI